MIAELAERFTAEARAILRHRLALGAGYLAAGQYTAAALNFLTNVVMARLLGPADYGLVALTVAYPTLLGSFVGVKSVSVITRYVAGFRATGERDKLRAVVKLGYGIDVLVSLLAFLLVSASAWWVAGHFYGRSDLARLMVVYAGSFPLVALAGSSWAVLSSWERFRILAVFEVLSPFVKLLLIIGLILAGRGVAGAVLGMAVAQAVVGVGMMVAAVQVMEKDGVGRWLGVSLKPVADIQREIGQFFGWNYLLVTLSGLVGQVPLMLLGRFRGAEEVGFYRLALSIVTVGSYINSSLGYVVYPALSARFASGGQEKALASIPRWTVRGGLPLGLFLGASILLFPILIPAVFGRPYAPAILATQVLMLGKIVSVIVFWLQSLYYAWGKVGTWVKGYFLYATVVVVGGWYVVPKWGVLGLAALIASTEALFLLGMLALALRRRAWKEAGSRDA
ncbi:hypothetical protein HRbin11_01429 [bacterium HR11]|nr:hypothetical protein HRbin11_01429 [bacterium HR11]